MQNDFSLLEQVLSLCMASMTILSVLMMGNFNKKAWVLGIVNQMISSFYYVKTGQYPLLIMTATLLVLSVNNLILWSKAAKKKEDHGTKRTRRKIQKTVLRKARKSTKTGQRYIDMARTGV